MSDHETHRRFDVAALAASRSRCCRSRGAEAGSRSPARASSIPSPSRPSSSRPPTEPGAPVLGVGLDWRS